MIYVIDLSNKNKMLRRGFIFFQNTGRWKQIFFSVILEIRNFSYMRFFFFTKWSMFRWSILLILVYNFNLVTLLYLYLMLNCSGRGSNKMHQGGNYQDFLKWGVEGGVVFRSFSYNNWMSLRAFFPKKLQFDPPTLLTIRHKRVQGFFIQKIKSRFQI